MVNNRVIKSATSLSSRSFPHGVVPSSLVSVPLFLMVLMLGVGAPTFSVFKLICLISFQTLLGGICWRLFNQKREVGLIEFIGIGFALGATCITLVDQMFVFWRHRYIAFWIILIVFVLGLIAKHKHSLFPFHHNSSREYSLIHFLFAFSAACLAGFANGMQLVFMLYLGFAVFLYFKHEALNSRVYLTLTGIMFLGYFVLLKYLQPRTSYGPKYLRYFFSGSDDAIFSESLSNSLGRLGPWDNLAVVGHPIPYHWFSLALSSSIQNLIGAEPFFVTSIVTPILGCLVLLVLASLIVHELTQSRLAVVISLVAIVFSSTLPLAERDYQVIENFSTSNVFSFVWSLSAVFFLVLFSKHQKPIYAFLLVISSTLCFLSKVPHGVILAVAIVFYLLAAFRLRVLGFIAVFVVSIFLLISYFGTYLLFLQPLSYQDRSFSFPVNSSNLALGSRLYPLVPIFFICCFAISRLPMVSFSVWNALSVHAKSFAVGSTAASLASLCRFFVYGNSSESYFLNMGLMLGALMTGIGLGAHLSVGDRSIKKSFLFSFASGFFVYFFVLLFVRSVKMSWPFFLLPPAISLLSLFLISLISRNRKWLLSSSRIIFLLSASLLGSSVSVYLATDFDPSAIEFSSNVISVDELEALSWLRDQVDPDHIVATNRNLCEDLQPCDFKERHQMISAFSRQKVFIEGPRFLNGDRVYPVWAIDRIRSSLNFASTPSRTHARLLEIDGVDLFYLVKDFQTVQQDESKFLAASDLLFENSSVAIYRLNSSK